MLDGHCNDTAYCRVSEQVYRQVGNGDIKGSAGRNLAEYRQSLEEQCAFKSRLFPELYKDMFIMDPSTASAFFKMTTANVYGHVDQYCTSHPGSTGAQLAKRARKAAAAPKPVVARMSRARTTLPAPEEAADEEEVTEGMCLALLCTAVLCLAVQ